MFRYVSDLFAALKRFTASIHRMADATDLIADDLHGRIAPPETPRLTSAAVVDAGAETATLPARANGRAAKGVRP
jgi:hypothetical protein